MKEKILILGAAGFTGSHFSNYISKNKLTEKFLFLGVDNCKCNTLEFQTKKVDLTIPQKVNSLLTLEKPDYIINLVGTFESKNFSQLLKINVEISQNILELYHTKKIPVKNILLLGSAAEYGTCDNLPISENQAPSPITMYGLSKSFQTETALYYFKNHKINVIIARPFNLLGKGLSKSLSIGSFVDQIKKMEVNGSIQVGNINSKRDFIDIYDAIDAYWKLLLFGKPGEIYNICTGNSHSIKDILEILIKASGKKIDIIIKKELLKINDIKDSFGDNSKLIKSINWECKESIETSLVKMF